MSSARVLRSGGLLAGLLLTGLWLVAEPTPTPTPVPPRASENPEDSRARMPLRPTPFQPESKFPPPQQSEEEEERKANKPGEPELLHGEPAVFLDGQPFPEKQLYEPKLPQARRLRYAAADAKDAGDGSAERPWKDLQSALCSLEPGDRLVVASGIYAGAFRVTAAAGCRDGTPEAPIQFFARHAFLRPAGTDPVLTIEKAHWQFWETQFALTDSAAPGLVARGAGAHDIAIDQSHIYEGDGPALVLGNGSARITVSHCHIHHSSGVRIEAGTSEITLINNHLHHNHAASLSIGSGPAGPPARAIRLLGNRVNNDRGPALDLARCQDVSVLRNRFSNYRPDEDSGKGGQAIIVGACGGVVFEGNSVLEATVGVRLAGGPSGERPVGRVDFRRNYFENHLTAESTAFDIATSAPVRIWNNVIDHYAVPFRLAGDASGASIANNLIVAPQTAFSLPAAPKYQLFDYNVFGGETALPAQVGSETVKAVAWMKGRMPHSRVVSGLGFQDGDLGRVVGFSPVDAGTRLDGATFSGRAPDIGVADH